MAVPQMECLLLAEESSVLVHPAGVDVYRRADAREAAYLSTHTHTHTHTHHNLPDGAPETMDLHRLWLFMTTVDGGNIGSNSSRRGAARLAPLKLRGPLLLPSPPLFNVALSGTGPRRAAAIFLGGLETA